VPAGASNFTLAPGTTAPIAAAISLGVVIAPIVILNTRLPSSLASSARTVPRAASLE
jgi:hypothetical protein